MSCRHLRVIWSPTNKILRCMDCDSVAATAPQSMDRSADEIVRLKSELEAMRIARVEDHMTCARLESEIACLKRMLVDAGVVLP